MSDYLKIIGNYGISYLDDTLKGIAKGDLIIIGAEPGCGKSALAYDIAFENSKKNNVHLFALEADDREPYLRKEYQIISREYYNNINIHDNVEMSYRNFRLGKINLPEIQKQAKKEVEQYYKLTVHYREAYFTIETLINKLHEITSVPNICDLIVLDHIDYFDINDNVNENLQVTEIMKALRQFNILWEIPIIIVSHLRKKMNRKQIIPSMEDLYGTSNKAKQVKTIILLSPDYENANYEAGIYPTFFNIAKDRMGAGGHLIGSHVFNRKKNAYNQNYELYKLKYFGEEVERINERPRWAKNLSITFGS